MEIIENTTEEIKPVVKRKPRVKKIEDPIINENEELIKAIAEEIHPGFWDFGPLVEPSLLSRVPKETIYKKCSSKSCSTCEINPRNCRNANLEYLDTKNFKRLLIHFPEFTMTNSRNETYTIKDYYIAIIFNSDCSKLATSSLYGIRTTFTVEEYLTGFMHSHAETSYAGEPEHYTTWRLLCLGSDTALTEICCTLASNLNKEYLHELLLLLNIYVNWESIEGGPYRRFKDVYLNSDYFQNNSNHLERKYLNIFNGEDPETWKSFLREFVETYQSDSALIYPHLHADSILNLAACDLEYVFTVAFLQILWKKELRRSSSILNSNNEIDSAKVSEIVNNPALNVLFVMKINGSSLSTDKKLKDSIIKKIENMDNKIQTIDTNNLIFKNATIPFILEKSEEINNLINNKITPIFIDSNEVKFNNSLFSSFTSRFVSQFSKFKRNITFYICQDPQ